MKELADILIRLDSLSPFEKGVVLSVLAAELGKPKISPESMTQGPVSTEAVNDSLTKSVSRLAISDQRSEIADSEFTNSGEFRQLIQAVTACSADIPSGPGRKVVILNRVNSVRAAWEKVPKRLKKPFHLDESQAAGHSAKATSPPVAGEPPASNAVRGKFFPLSNSDEEEASSVTVKSP
jgi:hypothetical protein